MPHEWIQDLFEDHEGHLWAGTRLNGFFRFSADSTRNAPVVDLHFTYPDLPTPWVFQLFETSDRRFWVATSRGLAEFFPTGDEQGRRFHLYTAAQWPELSRHHRAQRRPRAGNLWLGTNGVGAMKLALDGFRTFGEPDGIVTVNAIFEDRAGDVCFRGAVLGDARTSVFEGATLDLLRADQGTLLLAAGLFRRAAIPLVHACGRDVLWLGAGAGHAAGPQRRVVGGNGGRPLPLSRGRSLRATQDGDTACRLHHGARARRAAGVPTL